MVAEMRLRTKAGLPFPPARSWFTVLLRYAEKPESPLCDLWIFMNSAKDDQWAAIKADYVADELTVNAICKKHHLTHGVLYRRIAKENWGKRRQSKQSSRTNLVTRLMGLLERQLDQMEINMTGTDDKEVALLGNMVRTLEKLIDLDQKDGDAVGDDKQDRDISDLRDKLAARIDQLRQN